MSAVKADNVGCLQHTLGRPCRSIWNVSACDLLSVANKICIRTLSIYDSDDFVAGPL